MLFLFNELYSFLSTIMDARKLRLISLTCLTLQAATSLLPHVPQPAISLEIQQQQQIMDLLLNLLQQGKRPRRFHNV